MRKTTFGVWGVLALTTTACGKKRADDTAASAAPVVVSVSDLVADYKANEVRADTKYKGKRVQVTGIVNDIKKNAFDQIFLELGKGGPFELEAAHAAFPKESTAGAAALDKGVTVTVDCSCEGKVAIIVNLRDCKFVGTPPASSGGAVASKDSTPKGGPSASDVCVKLEAAGVAKSCAPGDSPTQAKFEIAGMPGKHGTVVALGDDSAYAKYTTAVISSPPSSPLRPFVESRKARVVVHLQKGVPTATEAKAKGVVDAL